MDTEADNYPSEAIGLSNARDGRLQMGTTSVRRSTADGFFDL